MTDYSALAASDGNGEAVRATVQTNRSIGGTTLTVDHTTHWPVTKCIVTMGTLLSTGKLDPTTVQVFYGTASGTTITINSFAPGYSDLGSKQGDVAVIKPTTEWANAAAAAAAAMNTFVSTNGDWRTTSTPNTITALGNRSYSLVVNNTDLTGTLSPGMRLRTTRTVAAPTQCTSLNGTTQYYSRASASIAGMTFTNNWTVSAWVKITSYQNGQVIASRFNGTSGWIFSVDGSGRPTMNGYNAGSANFKGVSAYQSLPLNRWIHFAAQVDMSTGTNTPTTNYVMLNGVDVPAFITSGGTAPTALIQAGNLEIGSQNGGAFPWPGKIAQVAIYSAKVTQANILATISQGLAGNEASLISAYSFNNSINDLNANANNLTANGSAVATNADSPFGGQAGGTISSTKDYAIITGATFSTNTTLTVQVPEGCTIPTIGGLSLLEYSVMKVPYGMPLQDSKWTLIYYNRNQVSQSSPAAGTWYNPSNQLALPVPIGEWDVTGYGDLYGNRSSGGNARKATLATTAAAEDDRYYTAGTEASPTTDSASSLTPRRSMSNTTATTIYLNFNTPASGLVVLIMLGDTARLAIEAKLAYL